MNSRIFRAAFGVVALCILSACHPDRVEPITAAEENWITDVHVAAIHVERGGPDIPAEVMDNLSRHLRSVMDECATGQRPIDLRVRIDNFEDNSTAAAIFIGDTIGLSGSVLIEDPQTGDAKGVYYIDTLRSGGGFIGAIMLSGAEDNMPEIFAEKLCQEVFAGQIAEAERPETPGAAGTSMGHIYQPPEEPAVASEGSGSAADTGGSMTDSSVSTQGTPNQDVYKPPE